jgi:peroxiredoxin
VVRHRRAVLLGSLIVVIGFAAAAVTRSTTPTGDPGRAVPVRQAPTSVAGDRVDSANVETALKALDLIRPSRRKFAEDFTVKTPDGRMVRLSEYRGKVVFINFWATWCLPCREELPAMERLSQRTKKAGLVMLAVSVDADPKVIAPFLDAQRFTFTVGLDPKMELANTYGVRALPASFIVDPDGHLAALALGPRAWDNAASKALVEGLSRE